MEKEMSKEMDECLEYYCDYFAEQNMMEGKYAYDVLIDIQQQVKKLNIPAVSGWSELLLAFVEHIKKDNELTETVNANDVDAFLKREQ